MREKLELKILAIVVVLLLIGISAASLMVLTIEKESLYSTTKMGAKATAKIIARDVERVMLEGRADLTKTVLDDLKSASGIEEISVLNFQGREAFKKDAQVTESEVMKKIAATKASYDIQDVKRFVFYEPLENKERCRTCHAADPEIIGAVKVSVSIEKEYARSMNLIRIVILLTVLACFCFSIILWLLIRKMVISPIKSLEKAAHELSRGDLSFDIDLKSRGRDRKVQQGDKGFHDFGIRHT